MRVAVVGAGFSGLISAIALSEVSEVKIFEEHEEVGVPEHCTGIVSGKVWEKLSKYVPDYVNEGFLEEFFVGLPDGRGAVIKGPKNFAVKLKRKELEKEMLDYALSKGVMFERKLVLEVSPRGTVEGEKFDKVLLAEGWRAELSSRFGIAAKPRRVYGINLEVKGRTSRPGSVEVWFDKGLAPGFFAWVVMLEDKAVVGTAATKGHNVRALARKVLEKAKERGLVEGEVVKEYGGVIQTGPPTKAPCYKALCSTGDAAGLNKPVTGGGLYPSLSVAEKYPRYLNGKLVKAYSIIPRLYAETLVARMLHGAPQKLYEEVFTALDGEVWRVKEYDNHVKSVKEIVKSMGAHKLVEALLAALRGLLPQPL